MGYMNDHDQAKDVAQETFISVWQHLPKFRNESSIGTWVFRIASNHYLRQIEKERRMPKSELPAQIEDKPTASDETKTQLLYNALPNYPKLTALLFRWSRKI